MILDTIVYGDLTILDLLWIAVCLMVAVLVAKVVAINIKNTHDLLSQCLYCL